MSSWGCLQVANLLMGGKRLEFPEHPPGGTFSGLGEYQALISRCWLQNPEDRPTFIGIVTALR